MAFAGEGLFGEAAGNTALFKVRTRLDTSDGLGEGWSCPSAPLADDNGGGNDDEALWVAAASTPAGAGGGGTSALVSPKCAFN